MGEVKEKPLFTVEQYLAIERSSEDRHEFVDGIIYDMAGESLAHGDISVNIVISLGIQLKGTPCRVLTKDSKLRSGPRSRSHASRKGMFSYPDVFVVCGEPEFHDDHRDVILNPKVIIEILSPSTDSFDRGDKRERYQMWLPTLKEYVIVSQDAPLVEKFTRRPNGEWPAKRFETLDAVVPLPSIRCELLLRDVYDRVDFAKPD